VPEFYPEARWQRCVVVHFYRNVFSHTPNNKVAEVARMLKAIHAQEDAASGLAKSADVVAKLRAMNLTRAADLVANHGQETLTYFAFPSNHWRQIKTNNPLERIIREIRRRTHVVGAFPDGHSALMLVAARLRLSALGKAALPCDGASAQPHSTGGSGLNARPATAKKCAKDSLHYPHSRQH